MLDYYLYSLDIQKNNDVKEQILKDLKNESKDKTVVISSVREPYDYKKFISLSREIKEELFRSGFKKFVHFVHDVCSHEHVEEHVIPIHWHVLDLDFRKQYENVSTNKKWNNSSDNVLFLNMKSNKPQRVGLLYKLIDRGLLDNLVYSFYPNHMVALNNELTTQEIYKAVSGKNDFDEFCAEYANSLDIISNPFIENKSHLTIGFPYDVTLFEKTCLNLTSESLWGGDKKVFLTEKIWKAIVNNQPFIVAGQPNTLSYLENLGFRTFRNYLKYPDYDNESDHLEKLNKIIDNVEYFLENKHTYENDIRQDVEFNRQQFEMLVQSERKKHYLLEDRDFYYDFLNKTKFLNTVE